MDDRYEIIEVWRRPLRGEPRAAVRVLAKTESGAAGPEEYAVGLSTLAEAQLLPMLDDADLFTGLSFAEAHWLAAVIDGASETVEDAEHLLFDLRVPVDLTWRDVDLQSEVIEPGGVRSQPLLSWRPAGTDIPVGAQYGIATYTLDCGHQSVEILRQDPDVAPFWLEETGVEELVARDARSLVRLLMGEPTLEAAHRIVAQYQENMIVHPEDLDEDEDGDDD